MDTDVKYVDLGLPSGTLWADRNVGAERIEEVGTLMPKAEAGPRLPSYEMAVELIEKCNFSLCLVEGADGRMKNCIKAEGPNGNSIFFPCSDEVDEAFVGPAVSVWCDREYGWSMSAFMLFQTKLLGVLDFAEIANLTIGSSSASTLKMVRYVRCPREEEAYLKSVIDELVSNMVYVEGGSFMMGSDDSDAYDDEKPVHREYVSSFRIGKYEVTQREWKAVMGNNPSHFKGDDLPVENVSWDDCQQFIRKLNAITAKNFRLPTEAEWEYAARGGNLSRGYRYSGSDDIRDVAWCYDGGRVSTCAVGTKSANELELYDMSGNVWEWTSDRWRCNYNSEHSSPDFIFRGGSWSTRARNCRISYRSFGGRSNRSNGLGLRLAL